jgi:hypothetical protein
VYSRDASRLNSSARVGHRSTAWCTLADIALRIGQPYSRDEAIALGQPKESWDKLLNRIERHLSSNSVDSKELRLSPMLEFDSSRELFAGDGSDAANRLLQREYRKGFEVPSVA